MVQQTQPLARLMTLLSTPTMSSASMLIEPKSLTSTATLRPWLPLRMRLSRVVLPAPRKPVRMVTGIGGGPIGEIVFNVFHGQACSSSGCRASPLLLGRRGAHHLGPG